MNLLRGSADLIPLLYAHITRRLRDDFDMRERVDDEETWIGRERHSRKVTMHTPMIQRVVAL